MDVTLVCLNCNKEFLRRKGEHNRNAKLGRPTYCSISCHAKHTIDIRIPPDKRGTYDISQHAANHLDELSPFRYHMHMVRKRAKESTHKAIYDIDELFLKELWEKQNGICPYTGWKLISRTNVGDRSKLQPQHASLDRIDSSKGYVRGNVQFIAFMANMAKNTFSKEQLIEFCKSVAQNT